MAKIKLDNYNESVIIAKTLEIVVLKQAQRELKDAPKDVISDVFALFDDLASTASFMSSKLAMPFTSSTRRQKRRNPWIDRRWNC